MRQRPHKIWNVQTPDLDKSLRLAAELGVSPLVGQLLVSRQVTDAEKARIYLSPKFTEFENLYNPSQLEDMSKAVERIQKAIDRGEKICIYGDYDADGTTATALLVDAFRQVGVPKNQVDYYIPNRFTDGYGLSQQTIQKIHEKETKLLITVDCGIKSVEEVKLASDHGMDVIITDHHEPGPDGPPPACALIARRCRKVITRVEIWLVLA